MKSHKFWHPPFFDLPTKLDVNQSNSNLAADDLD